MNELKMKRLVLRNESRRFGPELVEIPRAQFPKNAFANAKAPVRAWRNRDFLLQLWEEPLSGGGTALRLSINRAELGKDGRWKDGITWDDLQRLKNEAGFGSKWAVECFPPAGAVINVANIRHLWLLDAPPTTFGWLEEKGSQ